jgi:chromosome segregation ATPase
MAHTRQTARKKTGPKGVPRHQLAPRNDGASSSYRPNPSDLSRVDLIAELERLQEENDIVVKDRYQCAETIGEFQEETGKMRRTINHLKTKVGQLQGEKGELQREAIQLAAQNDALQHRVEELEISVELQEYGRELATNQLEATRLELQQAWFQEEQDVARINMLEGHVGVLHQWGHIQNEEITRLNNLLDPDFQRQVVAEDLGMVDNTVDPEPEEESSEEEEEDPDIVVPANDDGDHDDVDSHDDDA